MDPRPNLTPVSLTFELDQSCVTEPWLAVCGSMKGQQNDARKESDSGGRKVQTDQVLA